MSCFLLITCHTAGTCCPHSILSGFGYKDWTSPNRSADLCTPIHHPLHWCSICNLYDVIFIGFKWWILHCAVPHETLHSISLHAAVAVLNCMCKCHNTQQNSMLYYVDKTKKWHLCSKTLQKGKRVNVNPKTNKQKWTYKHKDKQAKLDLKTLRQTSERIYIQTRQTTKRVDTGTKTNNQEAHTNTKTSKQTITYKH